MFFSIIVPIYNIEDYIEPCIESIVSQDFKDYELILVDDGSTDNSSLKCKKYLSVPQVKYYKKNNGGLSDARNFGLKKAHGDFSIFFDGDDIMTEGALKSIKEEIISFDEEIDILCCNYYKIENDIKSIVSYIDSKSKKGIDFYKDQVINNPQHSNTAWRNIYRTSFLLENELFFCYGIIHEDEEWTPRVFIKGKNVRLSHNIFYNYVIRSGSIMTSKASYKSIDSWKIIFYNLKPVFGSIKDRELRNALLDSLVNQYLIIFRRIYSHIQYSKDDKIHLLPYRDLIECCFNLRTKEKLLLYLVSKRLFVKYKGNSK